MYSLCQQIMSKLFSGLSLFVIVFYFNVLLTTTAVRTTTNQNIGNFSQIIDSNVKNKTHPKTGTIDFITHHVTLPSIQFNCKSINSKQTNRLS